MLRPWINLCSPWLSPFCLLCSMCPWYAYIIKKNYQLVSLSRLSFSCLMRNHCYYSRCRQLFENALCNFTLMWQSPLYTCKFSVFFSQFFFHLFVFCGGWGWVCMLLQILSILSTKLPLLAWDAWCVKIFMKYTVTSYTGGYKATPKWKFSYWHYRICLWQIELP